MGTSVILGLPCEYEEKKENIKEISERLFLNRISCIISWIIIRRNRQEEKIMLTIGCHLSSAKGYEAMGREAVKIQANTFQFFTRNPRGGKAKEISPEDGKIFKALKTRDFLYSCPRALYIKRLFRG